MVRCEICISVCSVKLMLYFGDEATLLDRNFKLLSFGDEAEEDEEEAVFATKKMPNKSNSAHDIARDPTLSSDIDQSRERQEELKR